MELIDWWLKSFNFSDTEMNLLKSEEDDFDFSPVDYSDTKNLAIKSLPFNEGMKGYNIFFDSCATNIIDRLFDKYVTDDTLVISTYSEHPSVKKNLNKCKNVLYLFQNGKVELDTLEFEKHIKECKNVFVYFIALSMGDNQLTGNQTVMFLKDILSRYNKPYKIVLDAVQELFFLPRDYSIYDYIIGTAHAFVTLYDTGILFSKEFYESTPVCLFRGKKYLELISLLQAKKEQLYIFNYVMSQTFNHYLVSDKNLSVSYNGPFIFNMFDKQNRLYGLNKINEEALPEISNVTFRACESLLNQEEFKERVEKTKFVLEQN